MSLAQVHRQAGDATTAGGRAAAFVRGFASRIQNECNNGDVAAIRELCVQAAEAADDIAMTVEYGWADAEDRRAKVRDAAAVLAGAPPAPAGAVAASPTPHAGPTDRQHPGRPMSERETEEEREEREAEEKKAREDAEAAARMRGTAAQAGTVASAGTVANTGTAGRR